MRCEAKDCRIEIQEAFVWYGVDWQDNLRFFRFCEPCYKRACRSRDHLLCIQAPQTMIVP